MVNVGHWIHVKINASQKMYSVYVFRISLVGVSKRRRGSKTGEKK